MDDLGTLAVILAAALLGPVLSLLTRGTAPVVSSCPSYGMSVPSET